MIQVQKFEATIHLSFKRCQKEFARKLFPVHLDQLLLNSMVPRHYSDNDSQLFCMQNK